MRSFIFPIFQMGYLSHREFKCIDEGHIDGKRPGWTKPSNSNICPFKRNAILLHWLTEASSLQITPNRYITCTTYSCLCSFSHYLSHYPVLSFFHYQRNLYVVRWFVWFLQKSISSKRGSVKQTVNSKCHVFQLAVWPLPSHSPSLGLTFASPWPGRFAATEWFICFF